MTRFDRITTAVLSLLVAASGSTVGAQTNDDCLACHDDSELTGTRGGKTVSMQVSPKSLSRSVHDDLECIACHDALVGADLPHDEDLPPVTCGNCHDRQGAQHAQSLHGRAAARGDALAPSCSSCHGSHSILSSANPRSVTHVLKVPSLCGRCHHEGSPVSETRDIPQDRILENYSQSIHGQGLLKKGLTVTAVCTSCHTAHRILPHTDKRSSIAHENVARTCTRCHGLIEEVHRKVIDGKLWEEAPHEIPACVDCHSPHKIRRAFYPAGMANKDCLRCHGEPELAMERDGRTVSLFVDEAAYNASTHSGTACAQCHNEVTSSLTRSCETIESKVNCAVCHADQAGNYETSVHGQLAAKDDHDAPGCLDCHDKHATLSKRLPSSPTFPRNVPELCARCHRQGEKAAKRIHTGVPDIVQSYEMSIHGKGLRESGLVVTATCTDCHSSHLELPPSDPRSTVHPDRVGSTCGKCHHGIEEKFRTSIHFTAKGYTDKKLPNCEDCHTSHTISRTDRDDFRFRMMDQCGRCHESEATTFFDTFHGKVSRLGSAGAAKCYDCHGTHDILPPSDPSSKLSLPNVVGTCGQCHTGAHRQFAGYLSHATHHDRDKYPFLFWAFWGMTGLLVGTLGFAFVHTGAWLTRLYRTRAQWRQHKAAAAASRRLYRRFTAFQRGQHLVMLLSFFTLALTGMALKFSYMTWAQVFSRGLGGFGTMAVLHRMGAVVLIGVFITHLWGLAKQRKATGLSLWGLITHRDSILFNRNDLKELIGSLKWFAGLGPRPHYGRYTYWEKFDYFAVLWGVAIIGSTGLVLWFPELMTYVLPGWSVNVATIIHSDEALLAVAFIFTVHFFNTHFRPDKFPMDPVIFTGRVPVEELEHDKPREYQELVASGQLESRLVEAFPKPLERSLKVFGFTALGIGLTLIGLIVYSMLFGYQ